MVGNCGGCDAQWGGLLIAHCKSCHHSFMNIDGFDLHRVGRVGQTGHLTCQTPVKAGLVRNSFGVWRQPDEYDFAEKMKEVNDLKAA